MWHGMGSSECPSVLYNPTVYPSVRPSICLASWCFYGQVSQAPQAQEIRAVEAWLSYRMLEYRGIVNDCNEARGNYKMHLMDLAKKATFIGPVDAAAGSQGGSRGRAGTLRVALDLKMKSFWHHTKLFKDLLQLEDTTTKRSKQRVKERLSSTERESWRESGREREGEVRERACERARVCVCV